MEVIVPLYHPELPRTLCVKPMAGILLHGPPGCGKTKLARAIANETGVPLYQISATEVVSGVSGTELLKYQKLVMDLETNRVFAIRSSWLRIGAIDSSLLRPGRFGKLHYVPLPSQEEPALILQALSWKKPKKPLDPDVDLNSIAQMEACKNLGGADLRELMNEAAMAALEEPTSSEGSGAIKMKHLELALRNADLMSHLPVPLKYTCYPCGAGHKALPTTGKAVEGGRIFS
ncbi:hypothetical protein SAY87_012530 [Trapa incisa]|uniref:AAA+ ATPase domain-containing protein n=1 Tax=Trapa incisa TaxID=236973 RepID=A0AAN7GK65_9MYRT|nr:hypothetical protein SAY87_012530 [Trapa incisa]